MKPKSKNNELEHRLTELDPPYKSMEELMIGRLLDQYGIPFFYRQPTIVYSQGKNEINQPSFTLPGYEGLVIDYAPNTNGKQLLQQEQLYRYNQIPAVLLGPKSLMEPDWQESLYETLQQEAKRPNDLSRCRGT